MCCFIKVPNAWAGTTVMLVERGAVQSLTHQPAQTLKLPYLSPHQNHDFITLAYYGELTNILLKDFEVDLLTTDERLHI
ncbi:hypothetical protein UPYG_G00254180 [Umbra pygmaea]|uniref:Uncharacterized protein n=1 Tax=Umbra pygmaea TaxID=75934 RepID=A0ABD0W9N5_UMBPY